MKEFVEKLIERLEEATFDCVVAKDYMPKVVEFCEVEKIVNQLAEEYRPKTNFDYCCESVENMAQIIDIAKIGWAKEQIIEWLQSKAE